MVKGCNQHFVQEILV